MSPLFVSGASQPTLGGWEANEVGLSRTFLLKLESIRTTLTKLVASEQSERTAHYLYRR